jgi:hypothetical protein
VYFSSYVSFSSLPPYTFSIVGCCLAVQSLKKGKLIAMFPLSCFFLSFLLSLSPSFSFCRVFLHSVSLPFCWTLRYKEHYCYLLICLQGCLLPVRFHPRSSTTMHKCVHVYTQIKSCSIKNASITIILMLNACIRPRHVFLRRISSSSSSAASSSSPSSSS